MEIVYKYVGTRADHLLDGRPVGPGRLVRRVDPDDPLLSRSLLIEHSVEEDPVTEPEETPEKPDEAPVKTEEEAATEQPSANRRTRRKDTLSDSSGK